MNQQNGRKRVIIKHVTPEIDCGTYPVKRSIGESVKVEADIFADGHDEIRADLLFRKQGEKDWQKKTMQFEINDHWSGSFKLESEGWYEYTIQGWVDHFLTWQKDLKKRADAGQDVGVELLTGAGLVKAGIDQANPPKAEALRKYLSELDPGKDRDQALAYGLDPKLNELMRDLQSADKTAEYTHLQVECERKKALFSAWYELFPRSTSPEHGRHGTFQDVIRLLPEIAEMGFDILYLPPIHPIGKSVRKGKDNAPVAQPGDPGSPWAIGSDEGGHKTIHPQLGTMEDFQELIRKAAEFDIEIALDIAFQCSQDHPYVNQYPQWFNWRPDGTVQYAENPPKKYQDVLPFNFETPDWANLWNELKSIFEFWIDKGVKIFRVDNPHTKPFVFWEWIIKEIRSRNPEVILLAEAFTRPRIMEHLAKIGFNQSYTYFTWRNSRGEFIDYLKELTETQVREFFRPNFWPNTPDILPLSLQNKGEGAFIARFVMASTLSSNYGIYGPTFEFGLNKPHPDREEYIDNEKYEIKHWDWRKQTTIKDVIKQVNAIRKAHPALQTTWNIYFAENENQQLLCYAKTDEEQNDKLFIAVNLDPVFNQGGMTKVPLYEIGMDPEQSYRVRDLLNGGVYEWQGEWNYIELDPAGIPAHIFKIEG